MVIEKSVDNDTHEAYSFYCPGCGHDHVYYTRGKLAWQFNGDLEKPTFTPSLLNTFGDGRRCHLHVTNGRIEFCGDSTHAYAGKTVEMAARK